MECLPDQRSDRAPGLNNRSLGSKRAAGTDRNGSRKRFQDRNPWLNTAAIYHHRFHRLGNTMPFNLRASILRHEADDDSANHRDRNHPQAKLVMSRAQEFRNEAMVKENIGEQANQLVQDKRD